MTVTRTTQQIATRRSVGGRAVEVGGTVASFVALLIAWSPSGRSRSGSEDCGHVVLGRPEALDAVDGREDQLVPCGTGRGRGQGTHAGHDAGGLDHAVAALDPAGLV